MPTQGSMWIEGTSLHWIAGTTDYYVEGENLGASVGTPGSIWIDGVVIRYVDESGNYRSIGTDQGVVNLGDANSSAIYGSIWLDDGSTQPSEPSRLLFIGFDGINTKKLRVTGTPA